MRPRFLARLASTAFTSGTAIWRASLNGDAKAGSANVQKVVDDLIELANSASIPIGLPTWSSGEFSRYAEQGARLLTIGGDLSFLAVQAEAELMNVRRVLNGGHPQPGKP
jgi:2-keto-3-deoxy-L-rhamnonate aldolase RhmA